MNWQTDGICHMLQLPKLQLSKLSGSALRSRDGFAGLEGPCGRALPSPPGWPFEHLKVSSYNRIRQGPQQPKMVSAATAPTHDQMAYTRIAYEQAPRAKERRREDGLDV